MSRIDARGVLAMALTFALTLVTATALAQPEQLYDDLGPAGSLGVMLAAIFAASALVGVLIMLIFTLREINRTGPRVR